MGQLSAALMIAGSGRVLQARRAPCCRVKAAPLRPHPPSYFLCTSASFERAWREAGVALQRSQRMCAVGSFQHGSSSTKNSAAAPCQTILVPDVRQTEREKQRRGGGDRSSHIRHVPVEIRPLCLSLSAKKRKTSWLFEDFSFFLL